MKYFAIIESGATRSHLEAKTPSRLAEAVSENVERFVDTVVSTISSGRQNSITVTAFGRDETFWVSEVDGEWNSYEPKKRGF